MSINNYENLIITALDARNKAYAPYSSFFVGAALLTKEGKIFTGCNIENAAYSPTNCAERTAFFKAVSDGKRDFTAIAIVGGKSSEEALKSYASPCGVCRQVMAEFCDPNEFEIVVAKSEKDYKVFKLIELLPEGFYPSNLA